jgi:Domain of unknown function (DUF4395)
MNGIPRPLVRANQWFQVLSVVFALITGQYWILLLPLLTGLYSLIVGQNPVFWVVRPFLRKPHSHYAMEDPDQQRFNQMIAAVCLVFSLIGFYAGVPAVGYVFAILLGIAAFVAILGFCIGCFIRYQYLRYKQRKA